MKCIFFLSLLALGCNHSEVFYVSDAFSAQEQAAIQEAANYWETVANTHQHIDLVFQAHVNPCEYERNVVVRLTAPNPCFPLSLSNPREVGEEVSSRDITWQSHDRIALFADRIWTWDYLTVTAAHEFGHFLGMGHVEDPTALLFWSPSGNAYGFIDAGCIGPADAEEYCRRQSCAVLPQLC